MGKVDVANAVVRSTSPGRTTGVAGLLNASAVDTTMAASKLVMAVVVFMMLLLLLVVNYIHMKIGKHLWSVFCIIFHLAEWFHSMSH